jgi:hypothetical protein
MKMGTSTGQLELIILITSVNLTTIKNTDRLVPWLCRYGKNAVAILAQWEGPQSVPQKIN